jgi:hypothetical protein
MIITEILTLPLGKISEIYLLSESEIVLTIFSNSGVPSIRATETTSETRDREVAFRVERHLHRVRPVSRSQHGRARPQERDNSLRKDLRTNDVIFFIIKNLHILQVLLLFILMLFAIH